MTRDSFFRLEDESVEMEPDVGGPVKSLLLSWPGIVCEVILVTFKLAFLVTLSLTLAVLTYSSYTYLDPSTPQEELISLNVPLNFETCEVTVFPISTFEQNLKQFLQATEERCSDVWGNITLKYRPGNGGPLKRRIPVLVEGQKYRVEILLKMPENDINKQVRLYVQLIMSYSILSVTY